jgi:hypothetical protein
MAPDSSLIRICHSSVLFSWDIASNISGSGQRHCGKLRMAKVGTRKDIVPPCTIGNLQWGSRVKAGTWCYWYRIIIGQTLTLWSSSSWEADNQSVDQETPHLLRNPKVHCHIRKSLQLAPILGQLDQVHICIPCFQKNPFNTSVSDKPKTPKWSLLFIFPTNIFY